MAQSRNETEARQGENSRRMPFVLGLSVLLILAGFAGIYGYTQLSSPRQDVNASVNSTKK